MYDQSNKSNTNIKGKKNAKLICSRNHEVVYNVLEFLEDLSENVNLLQLILLNRKKDNKDNKDTGTKLNQ